MWVNFLMRKLSEKVESLFRLLHSKSDWEEHLLCWVCLFFLACNFQLLQQFNPSLKNTLMFSSNIFFI